jgi:hypothetical protein
MWIHGAFGAARGSRSELDETRLPVVGESVAGPIVHLCKPVIPVDHCDAVDRGGHLTTSHRDDELRLTQILESLQTIEQIDTGHDHGHIGPIDHVVEQRPFGE